MIKKIALNVFIFGGFTCLVIGAFKLHQSIGYLMLGICLFITGLAINEVYFK